MFDNQDKIIQNLKDANCNNNLISKFLELEKSNKVNEQLKLRSIHRKNLLDTLHENQKQIECLDYLIFTIKQKGIL